MVIKINVRIQEPGKCKKLKERNISCDQKSNVIFFFMSEFKDSSNLESKRGTAS